MFTFSDSGASLYKFLCAASHDLWLCVARLSGQSSYPVMEDLGSADFGWLERFPSDAMAVFAAGISAHHQGWCVARCHENHRRLRGWDACAIFSQFPRIDHIDLRKIHRKPYRDSICHYTSLYDTICHYIQQGTSLISTYFNWLFPMTGHFRQAMTGSSNAQVISFVTAIDPFALTRTNLLEKFPLKAAMAPKDTWNVLENGKWMFILFHPNIIIYIYIYMIYLYWAKKIQKGF